MGLPLEEYLVNPHDHPIRNYEDKVTYSHTLIVRVAWPLAKITVWASCQLHPTVRILGKLY
ncbi:hypothetical protein [Moorena producens]|uniref:hypothetical protein n=1 Tax=Moorena producens TaxID=1155739 RepID=UPI003C7204ED